jgi:hypothetical protein
MLSSPFFQQQAPLDICSGSPLFDSKSIDLSAPAISSPSASIEFQPAQLSLFCPRISHSLLY